MPEFISSTATDDPGNNLFRMTFSMYSDFFQIKNAGLNQQAGVFISLFFQ